MKIFTKFKELFAHSATQRKERMVIITTLLCFAISGIALPQIKAQEGTLLDASTVQQEQSTEDSDSSSSLKEKKEEQKKEPEEQKEEETSEEEKEESKEEKESSTDKKEAEEKESSTDKKEAEKKESEKKASEDNTAANNGSSSSSNNSGSTPAAPAPQPEKVWVPPVYKTVHHDAVYNTVTVVVCNYCGAEFGSAGEFQAHKDANGG